MAVISVRLNSEEEKIMDYLSTFYDEEKSTLIKHSLKEMFEDIVDNEVIDFFDKEEKKNTLSFVNAEDILKELAKEPKKK